MAQSFSQSDHLTQSRGLKLDTHPDNHEQSFHVASPEQKQFPRPVYRGSELSEDTIRACATPPIEIPGHRDDVAVESASPAHFSNSLVEGHLKHRDQSNNFNNEVRPGPGHRHSVLEPARKPVRNGYRGRSLAQALSEHHTARAHSESDRAHYDPHTGNKLPQYSYSPPHEEPRVGEARFPLLQQTVDALARQGIDTQQSMSLTSESTMSPVEETVVTPDDVDNRYLTSPVGISPSIVKHFSSSYESPRVRSQRKASERWRDGEGAQDFFSRAGSLKRADRDPGRRTSGRGIAGSVKSPGSAASSYLRGFSMSSSTDDSSAPPPVDAEGATIGEDYVLGKQIGFGGFSTIREVKQITSQTGSQRTLAVKIVKKRIDGKTRTENEQAQSEFEHEVDLWRLLNHKRVLELEAVYDLKEATFCFIPLNTGGTLFDVVSNNRQGLALDIAANFSYQLASALRYLHLDARVVHRDIKLENCLVDTTRGEPGLLRLCDFGLAEWISSDNDSTDGFSAMSSEQERQINKFFGPANSSTSAFAGGSLEYAAPEILKIATSTSGNVQEGDLPPASSIVAPAVDIWAMGVCIYALLVGRRPFQDNFQPRVVMAILAGDWDRTKLKDKVNEQAYDIVETCLDRDALTRPTINDIIENPWFDEARAIDDGSDGDSESAKAGGWRL